MGNVQYADISEYLKRRVALMNPSLGVLDIPPRVVALDTLSVSEYILKVRFLVSSVALSFVWFISGIALTRHPRM